VLDNEGFSVQIKRDFIFCLLCSARPIHELIDPNLIDQCIAFDKQIESMSAINFSYNDFEENRNILIKKIVECLNNLEVDWSEYNFKDFPSVKWKLINLEKLKKEILISMICNQ
jgi:hypothetical protein